MKDTHRLSERTIFISTVFVFIMLLFMPIVQIAAGDDSDGDGVEDDAEKTLAAKYAPVLYFEEEEEFFPVEIGYHLNVSNLNESVQGEDLVNATTPTIEDIAEKNDTEGKYYLDNREGSLNDDGIEKHYVEHRDELGYTIYARVTLEVYDLNEYTIIQYWMFYAFNKGPLNTHEGDWEMVQIVLDENEKPIKAMYSQHTEGERAEWSDVERDGDHIKVYVARGSHANYFRSYQGKLSLGNDDVGDNGEVLEPSDYTLVNLGEKENGNHTEDQNWLEYAGRWGEYGSEEDELRGKRGPHGPVFREEGRMWDEPMEWGGDLREVDENIFRLNWFFYNFVTIFIVLALLSFIIKVLRIVKRKHDTGLGKRIFSILYIDGPNLKSIGNLLTIIGICFAIMSLFNPWYSISVDIESGDFNTDGMVEVVSIDGTDGVQVNTLESNSGTVQLFSFPLPFSLLIGLAIFFLVLGTVGLQKSATLGGKYLWSGIKLLIPVIIILLLIAQTSNIIGMAPVEMDEETEELVDTVSSEPLGGEDETQIGEYGTAKVEWGLEAGGWYLAYAGILLFIGGICEIMANKELFESKKGKEKSIQEVKERVEELEGRIDGKHLSEEKEGKDHSEENGKEESPTDT